MGPALAAAALEGFYQAVSGKCACEPQAKPGQGTHFPNRKNVAVASLYRVLGAVVYQVLMTQVRGWEIFRLFGP